MSSSSRDYKSGSHKRHPDADEERDRKSSKHSKISSSLKSSIKPIDEDDYFEKATEFRLWLREYKHKYFDELSSKEARRYFRKFVKKWNDYDLDEKFYKGMNSAQLDSSDTTRYKWSFAKKLDNQWELDTIRDNVESMTGTSMDDKRVNSKRRALPVGPAMPNSNTLTLEREERYERERADRKYESRRRAERKEAILDEVAPKEIGREAALAKKRALNAYHKRERSPDIELSEADLMGGDDFQARLAAERRAKENREARKQERQNQKLAPILSKMDEYKAKENATMEMFRKMAEEQKKRGAFQ
ncbi:MAG: hypothetical protein EXX96DRAFT_547017 [Benjaminiella poitrasii]|nr:MAG: hypothetical protein EXX96DRAFT_547017 [Benjaminiella poitrasii]